MARILISCFSPTLDQGKPVLTCMYEGFIEALKKEGNQILLINTHSFLPRPWNGSNDLAVVLDGTRLAADVAAFDPQIVFAFNHSIPTPVLDVVRCPVVLWDSDSLQFYNDKDVIRKNMNRYYFFCFSRHGVENAIQFGAAKERVFFVPAATAVEAEKIDLKHNISFIGTMFQNGPNLTDFMENYDHAEKDKILTLVRQGYSHINDDFIVERRSQIEKYIPLGDLFGIYSPAKRLGVLNNTADLGLSIYGASHWLELARFFPDLALAYQPGNIYSLRHNQDIYNGSKLCLNISHAQVVDGYAWRVLDVMASSGCLLTDRSQGIADLLKGYIDLPMFDDVTGARKLAQQLLQDDKMRMDIVQASQRCIAENGRWKHRFADIEVILSVRLLAADGLGSVRELEARSYVNAAREKIMAPMKNSRQILRSLVYRFGITRWLISQKGVRRLITAFR